MEFVVSAVAVAHNFAEVGKNFAELLVGRNFAANSAA